MLRRLECRLLMAAGSQKDVLNITGNVKHGIKTGEYFTLKNATVNILSAVGDGISCNEYFLMESGFVNIADTAMTGYSVTLTVAHLPESPPIMRMRTAATFISAEALSILAEQPK